jgi:uncharacterized protein YdbL (DUF1318 family)
MNSITRLILRRVVSGNVKLTPRLFEVLNELDQDQSDTGTPEKTGKRIINAARSSKCEAPAKENRLTFINPLPGRWIRRTECAVGVALLLAIGLAQAASSSAAFETANNDFAQGKYAEAAHGYETIIEQQDYSAPVLFNLANAQQRARSGHGCFARDDGRTGVQVAGRGNREIATKSRRLCARPEPRRARWLGQD